MLTLNNPLGVLRQPNIEWHGQVKGFEGRSAAGDQSSDPELVAFVAPEFSVRAAARQLLALGRHGRRATPTTIALSFGLGGLARLCVAANASSDDGIDVSDADTARRIMRVIAAEKTGADIDDATLDEGLILACILEPKD